MLGSGLSISVAGMLMASDIDRSLILPATEMLRNCLIVNHGYSNRALGTDCNDMEFSLSFVAMSFELELS